MQFISKDFSLFTFLGYTRFWRYFLAKTSEDQSSLQRQIQTTKPNQRGKEPKKQKEKRWEVQVLSSQIFTWLKLTVSNAWIQELLWISTPQGQNWIFLAENASKSSADLFVLLLKIPWRNREKLVEQMLAVLVQLLKIDLVRFKHKREIPKWLLCKRLSF